MEMVMILERVDLVVLRGADSTLLLLRLRLDVWARRASFWESSFRLRFRELTSLCRLSSLSKMISSKLDLALVDGCGVSSDSESVSVR